MFVSNHHRPTQPEPVQPIQVLDVLDGLFNHIFKGPGWREKAEGVAGFPPATVANDGGKRQDPKLQVSPQMFRDEVKQTIEPSRIVLYFGANNPPFLNPDGGFTSGK